MAIKGGNSRKFCIRCKKDKVITNFYSTDSDMFSDGKVPICKSCIKKEVSEDDIDSVKKILRQIDKPFIVDAWNTAKNSTADTFGTYIKMINSLIQYKGLTYEDSDSDKKIREEVVLSLDEDVYEPFKPTREMIVKWGSNFQPDEYLKLEETWNDMMVANDITTPQHKKNLAQYCKLSVLMDRALDNGQYGDYDKLKKQFDNTEKSSGFRPIDRKSGSESAGIRTFSQIFEEIERDGFIKPAPIDVEPDIVDMTILYMANYTKRLFNQELLSEPPDDIWDFIEGKVEEEEGDY